nr:DNA mismatch repair protein MutL [Verrucomicrobiota bacterium]
KIVEVKAAGSAPGTSVEVRQLFFNLPARRKFMRTEETEAAHVQHYLTLAALAFPEVAFTFIKDGRTIWQLAAHQSGPSAAEKLAALRERLRALLGEAKLLPVEFTTEFIESRAVPEEESFETALPANTPSPAPQVSSFRLWGLIGVPGVSRSTREDQFVFVNRRPVENRGVNFALLEGYHTALMKGRYPVCCLFLEIDPAAVDVNIHPSKREVKFHREGDVRRSVAQGVREALLKFHSPETSKEDRHLPTSKPQRPTESPPAILPPPETGELPNFVAASAKSVSPAPQQAPLRMGFAPKPVASGNQLTQSPVAASTRIPTSKPTALPTESLPASAFRPPPSASPLLSVPLRLVGVVGKLYVVLESDRGLVLLDQHAAHERILFEQMLERLERGVQSPAQRLLLPETLELSPRDANFLRGQLATLTRLGVGLSEFGERTFLLDALPPFVKVADARTFALNLVDELKAAGQEVNSARLGEHVVAKTVCRHAVKANDPLKGRELENLVEDLRRCAMPYTCPHGRPTIIEMNYRELDRKFGRVQ